jgi:hypothetical protein
MTKSRLPFSMIGAAAVLRQRLLLGSALAALCAGAVPAAGQTYVGNDFSAGTSLLTALQSDGYKDNVAPFVILQEYNSSGPATSGAIFTSAGTVNDVSFYGGFSGGGKYDFTVYALALDSSNAAKNQQTFTVVGDETFSGTVASQGAHTLSADFSVGAEDYLAFSGIGPFYPQQPNDAVGSDATYESSPNTNTATPPSAGQTFTVGANGGSATYNYISDIHSNQGRSYGIGVDYTPVAPPKTYWLNSASLGQTNLSWSNAGGTQRNWVDQTAAVTTPPTPGGNVFIGPLTGANASGPTVVNFDAATDPKVNSLTIDSNNPYAGGKLVEFTQPAYSQISLTSGSEMIGMSGPAEYLQFGGVNNVTGALTIGGFGTYDQFGTLNASSITVNPGGTFLFDGGTTTFTSFTNYGSVGPGSSSSAEEVIAGRATSTFTQLSGVNEAEQLGVGNAANTSGVYSLQGGLLQVTDNESIGQNGFGKFIQSGNSTNSINGQTGTLNVSGANLRSVVAGAQSTPTSYLLQGGTLTAVEENIDGVNPSAPGPGYFLQTGGTNNAGSLGVLTNGTYILRSGALFVSGGLAVDGTVTQNGIYSIAQYGIFSMYGGTAVVNNNLDNSGEVTISGAGVTLVVDGNVNNSADLWIQNGAILDPALTTSSAGTIGGTGTIVGPVKVTGGAVIADNLHIEGAYNQTGGIITFDIDPDGKGGFLESSLVFDPGDVVSITGTKIVFDFLDGANPLTFFKSGAFNLDAFFAESDGSLFSSDFNLESLFAGDTFATNMRGFGIAGFGADGAIALAESSAVPEPSTWVMMLLGFAGLGFASWRASHKTGFGRI